MGMIRRSFGKTTSQPITETEPAPKPTISRKVFRKVSVPKAPKPAAPDGEKSPLSATSVTSRRKQPKAEPVVPEVKTADDYIGEYLRSLPEDAIPYTELVQKYVLPQMAVPMFVFGKELRITPTYVSTICNRVKIVGILCEVDTGSRGIKNFKSKKRISGNRNLWYSQIKYHVKLSME